MIKKYNELLIIGILWLVSIYSITVALTNSYDIEDPNIIAYGLLIGITILRIFSIKRSKTVLGIILIVGSLNLIQFSYSTITVIFSWSPFGNNFSTVGIQPLSFALLVLLITLNFSEMISLLSSLLAEDPQIAIDRKERRILKNYEELKSENDDKLRQIIQNRKMYQAEYVRAAQRLIEERHDK